MTPHVLLIDDDQRLAELLVRYFERFDLQLEHAAAPRSGLKKLDNGRFDLVILDVMDRVVGLEIGADDYLSKPFEPRELVARIQNILKRTVRTAVSTAVLDFGALVIDTQHRLNRDLNEMEKLIEELLETERLTASHVDG